MGIESVLLASLFLNPILVPTEPVSLLWVIPICLGIALVYKAIRLENIAPQVYAREVAQLFVTIVGFLIVVSFCLLGIVFLAIH